MIEGTRKFYAGNVAKMAARLLRRIPQLRQQYWQEAIEYERENGTYLFFFKWKPSHTDSQIKSHLQTWGGVEENYDGLYETQYRLAQWAHQESSVRYASTDAMELNINVAEVLMTNFASDNPLLEEPVE